MPKLYDTQPWREFRGSVLAADAECALTRLAGDCKGPLHVHHVEPVAEGGPVFPSQDGLAVLCARHHRLVHAWRRQQEPRSRRCPHNHRYTWAREQCEQRLNAA